MKDGVRLFQELQKTKNGNTIIYCESLADGVVTEDDDENDVLAAMVKVLAIKICKNRALIPESSEAPFFDKSLIHAIREVSLETTEKNVMYAIQTGCKKFDFMIGTRRNKKAYYFFYIEVKRPDVTSKLQIEDDFTNLLNFMKSSIDK